MGVEPIHDAYETPEPTKAQPRNVMWLTTIVSFTRPNESRHRRCVPLDSNQYGRDFNPML